MTQPAIKFFLLAMLALPSPLLSAKAVAQNVAQDVAQDSSPKTSPKDSSPKTTSPKTSPNGSPPKTTSPKTSPNGSPPKTTSPKASPKASGKAPTNPASNSNKSIYDFATALEDAKKNDPRLKATNQAVIAAGARNDITKTAILPTLDAAAYIGHYDQERYQSLPNFITIFGQRFEFGARPGLVTVTGTLRGASLTANQNLITFGRQQASEAISKSEYRLAKWQAQQVLGQLTIDVANSYINCATAGEIAKTTEFYIISLRGIYDDVKRKYDINAATITDLNLAAINYRDSTNDLLLQKQRIASTCKTLLRLTAQEMDYKELLARLSLADLDQYIKLIPNDFDEVKNVVLARDPNLGVAMENLAISRKRKELTAANLMPSASWDAKVEQTVIPTSTSRLGTTPASVINNQSITVGLNYQQNIMQNAYQLSTENHLVVAQSHLTASQLTNSNNDILNIWQNYQAGKKSIPYMVQTLNESNLALDGVTKIYDRGVARLSFLLEKRQEFLVNVIEYHRLRERHLSSSMTLLTLMGLLS